MLHAVVVILDGVRRDSVTPELMPCLSAFAAGATGFAAHRSVFPSATRVVSSTMATGCFPARHGLQGNTVVLMEAGRLVRRDAGLPDFLQHRRAITGTSLAMPTMAQRLAPHGGALIFSNVSPGAAYTHDPDGYGHLYHRAGSFGPGRVALADGLDIACDIEGDRVMTERFIAVLPRRAALSMIWMGEPDHMQHAVPLGSPEHLAVLRAADAHAGLIIDAVAARRAAGEDVLLIVASDHGHETVSGVVDVEGALVAAGLKAAMDSDDVVSAANGCSCLIYVHPDQRARIPAIGAFLRGQDWAGRVFDAVDLAEVGQSTAGGLAFAVAMRSSLEINAYGVPGLSLVAMPSDGKPDRLGCGQHGGLGTWEQSPFLMIAGSGFATEAMRRDPTSAVDIAPTVLAHLGLPASGMDGRPLQQ